MHALICSTFLILASGLLLVTAYRSSGYPMSGAVAPSSVSCTMFSFLHLALASSLSEHTVVELKEVDCMHANPEKRERDGGQDECDVCEYGHSPYVEFIVSLMHSCIMGSRPSLLKSCRRCCRESSQGFKCLACE
jgi:hypothetical protein